MGVGFVPPPGRRCLPLRGNCAHSGRGFPLSGDEVCAPAGGGGIFLSGNEMRPPHFFFSGTEKKKRAAPGAKKKRGLG